MGIASANELRVPDIGDSKDVSVIELLVQVGDTVSLGQNLLVIETDKATMEIPAEHAGVIRELKIGVGGKVSRGTVIALLEPAGEVVVTTAPVAAPRAPAAVVAVSSPPVSEPRQTPPPPLPLLAPAASAPQTTIAHASPSIRKLARELGVPLEKVQGTGAKARITAEDVRDFVKRLVVEHATGAASTEQGTAATSGIGSAIASLPPWPMVDFAKFGPTERVELSRIRKRSGAVLHRNWVSIPHVTNHEDADITELEAFRVQLNREHEKTGTKFTLLALVIKACVAALKKFPEFNASLEGEQIVLKRYWHIGFAADTPNGLVVPVIRDADQKGLVDIAGESAALAAKAREGRLAPADMSGGSFSISSLGSIGGSYFTPIINAPEVAILGVGKSHTRVSWIGEKAVPRLILPLSLSWDHRVVDGAAAGRFNAYLAQVLGDFRRVML